MANEHVITSDMTISEIIRLEPRLAQALEGSGMMCVGCYASSGETLAEAAAVHDIDPFILEARMNAFYNEFQKGNL